MDGVCKIIENNGAVLGYTAVAVGALPLHGIAELALPLYDRIRRKDLVQEVRSVHGRSFISSDFTKPLTEGAERKRNTDRLELWMNFWRLARSLGGSKS